MGLNTLDDANLELLAEMAEESDPIIPEADEPEPLTEELADTPDKRQFFRDMMSGNLPPKPRKREPKTPKTPRVKKPVVTPAKPRTGQLKVPLQKLYTSMGMALMAVDPVCGTAIVMNAEACAVAVEELARQNEAVRRIVYQLISTSAWGAVVVAHMPILFAIAVHHIPVMANSPVAAKVQAVMNMPTPDLSSAEAGAEAA